MNAYTKCIALGLFVLLFSCKKEKTISFATETFRIALNEQGHVIGVMDLSTDQEYSPTAQESPLLAIVEDGKHKLPVSIRPNGENVFALSFAESKLTLDVKIQVKPTHISLAIEEVTQGDQLEAVLWGPYANTIKDIIGENIGVVRNSDFALGIQSLNPKTTAGKLDNVQGIVSYHGTAAEEKEFGSILQAFAINRTRDLSHSTWEGWENKYEGRPYHILNEEEGAVTGSAIALFGCKPSKVLDYIGEIEVAEGLPHPEIDGVWVKKLKETGRAYVISPFSEDNIDITIDYVKKAGLRSLYHEGPFESWGNFILDKELFPNGREGLKKCVSKAKDANLHMGVHTLTNFIMPNDPFVTPVPDKRLVSLGSTTLSREIGVADTEMEIADIKLLTVKKNSKLNTVRIGDELIQYGSFSEEKPYKLYDCKRGAWGTTASVHQKGDELVNLLDFAYNIFYPNWDMQKDMRNNLVTLLNECGITQMGFDGHEGCYATGHGDYAMDLFAQEWYDQLDHVVINSSSRLKHYYWHINHFINWGEPWYGGFRESQADRRFKVQPFLERNYLPNMLGWFMIKSTTIPSDIEWMMARAAGYNAGFALVLRLPELENNPYTDEILEIINTWEHARLAGAFTKEQRERLKDNNNEFHLEKKGDGGLVLHSFTSSSFEHVKKVLQPGEPTDSEWTFRNDAQEQKLQFRLTVSGEEGKISDVELEFDRSYTFNLPKEIKAGYSLVCDGSNLLRIYDAKGRFVQTFDMGSAPPKLRKGGHYFRTNCKFTGNDDLKVKLVIKQKGLEEQLKG
ncbi:MAG: hypothetical protein AAFX53_11375 [Bacteroidota bacterium]